jgi:hypothetical protein
MKYTLMVTVAENGMIKVQQTLQTDTFVETLSKIRSVTMTVMANALGVKPILTVLRKFHQLTSQASTTKPNKTKLISYFRMIKLKGKMLG